MSPIFPTSQGVSFFEMRRITFIRQDISIKDSLTISTSLSLMKHLELEQRHTSHIIVQVIKCKFNDLLKGTHDVHRRHIVEYFCNHYVCVLG